MDEGKGIQLLKRLRIKWLLVTVTAAFMAAAGLAFAVSMLLNRLAAVPAWWSGWVFLLIFPVLLYRQRVWRTNEKSLAEWLDRTYPQLEESSGLLLQPYTSLPLLRQLQAERTYSSLQNLSSVLQPWRKLRPAVLVLLLSFSTMAIPARKTKYIVDSRVLKSLVPKPANMPSRVTRATIHIIPPLYTRKPTRQQQGFNLSVEAGAEVQWQLQTSTTAQQVKFIFNDSAAAPLHINSKDGTQWLLRKKIDSSGFYQVNVEGQVSELFQIEVVPDRPPVIQLQSPEPYSSLDFGEPQQVAVRGTITDDYLLSDAFIAATIVSGSGEAVKFKEQKIALNGFSRERNQYKLQRTLLLPALGVQPGNEVYFYIQATDNHGQQARSDIYVIQVTDTAQLMSAEGLANSVVLKPEYFRSQRQIIIETEQLLRDKDSISPEAFRNRSNNLGLDQKLLRLRYSRFLGDENESGESPVNEVADSKDFSNAEKVKDAFTDKHDNEEDADFFEPETKKQLQAVLAQMWSAETRLRSFTPQTALLFEYKALRLLKDLQQKSRAYVAKTNFKTTAPDPHKRLTGDVSKVEQLVLQKDVSQSPDKLTAVRHALSILDGVRLEGKALNADLAVLQQANLRLHEQAIKQPGLYLPAVDAFRIIIAAVHSQASIPDYDILRAQKGLQRMLQARAPLPAADNGYPAKRLSKSYFDNLQKMRP